MTRLRPEKFFQSEKRRKRILYVTAALFFILCAETLFSCITAVFEDGDTHLDFHISLEKILCMIIYTTVACMLLKRAGYKVLLIPDFFLFIIKLTGVITGIYHLKSLATVGAYTSLNEWEHIVENGFFCIFLLTLFACELLPAKESMHFKLPYICLGALSLCFPFTLVFEAIKAVDEAILHTLPLKAAIFNFLMGVLNEAVLDLPYALLLMIIFFVPEKKSINHR